MLEASNRIGGRVYDFAATSGCGLIRMGAMFVTGVINNPFTVLVKQCDGGDSVKQGDHSDNAVKLIPIDEDSCELILERGVTARSDIDEKVEKNFNLTLDKLMEWRHTLASSSSSSSSCSNQDASLLGKDLVSF